jgi:hypothetical protein
MNWLNISIHTLDSENFLGSDPIERGTWLCLLRYCIGQENGGIITDCLDWGDRKWQQLVRITKKEAARSCDLWAWDGNSLIVWGYPIEKETEVREKRDRAKTNGAKGGRPTKTNVGSEEKPTSVNSAKAERNEKGKERNGSTTTTCISESGVVVDDSEPEPSDAMLSLENRVRSLRKDWSIPMTYAEMRTLRDNSRAILAINDKDWESIRQFLHHRPKEGEAYTVPRSRAKFLEWIPDVHRQALHWAAKNNLNKTATVNGRGF